VTVEERPFIFSRCHAVPLTKRYRCTYNSRR